MTQPSSSEISGSQVPLSAVYASEQDGSGVTMTVIVREDLTTGDDAQQLFDDVHAMLDSVVDSVVDSLQ